MTHVIVYSIMYNLLVGLKLHTMLTRVLWASFRIFITCRMLYGAFKSVLKTFEIFSQASNMPCVTFFILLLIRMHYVSYRIILCHMSLLGEFTCRSGFLLMQIEFHHVSLLMLASLWLSSWSLNAYRITIC